MYSVLFSHGSHSEPSNYSMPVKQGCGINGTRLSNYSHKKVCFGYQCIHPPAVEYSAEIIWLINRQYPTCMKNTSSTLQRVNSRYFNFDLIFSGSDNSVWYGVKASQIAIFGSERSLDWHLCYLHALDVGRIRRYLWVCITMYLFRWMRLHLRDTALG